MEKKLKIILCVLLIILISIISFVGVFTKDTYNYTSVLPDYQLSTEFKGKRISYFTVDTSSEETIYDADGNEVDEIPEGEDESNYTVETTYTNSEELLTTDNYKLVKSIFEGRLDELGVEEYQIRLDEETGDVVVELEDDTDTDTILNYLLCTGDFSITDTDTGEVLLDKSDIKNASVVYASSDSSTVTVYLDIQFNSEGTKKLEEISNEYMEIEEDDTEEETTEEETEEEETNEASEEETTSDEEDATEEESAETEEETSEEEEEEQKTITMTLEGTTFLTTYFAETISNGELTISLGSASTTSEVYEYISQGQVYAMLLNNDEMPLEYTVEGTEYIASTLGENTIYVIIGIMAAICVITIIYMIIRYRTNGLVAGLSFIAAIGIFLLLIRYTSTSISLGGLLAMLVLIVIDIFFMNKILSNIKKDNSYENTKKQTLQVYMDEIELIIVYLIVAIIFTFMSELEVYSIGMILFYGIISIAIANLVFMRNMLIAKSEGK